MVESEAFGWVRSRPMPGMKPGTTGDGDYTNNLWDGYQTQHLREKGDIQGLWDGDGTQPLVRRSSGPVKGELTSGTGIDPTTYATGIKPRTKGREWYPGMLGRESNPWPFFSKQPGPMGLGMDLWEGDETKNLFGTGSRNRTQEPRDGTYRAILSLQDMVSRRSPCSTPSQVWMVLLDLTGMVPSPDSILVLSWPLAFLLGWRSPWSGHTATAS